MKTFLKKIYFLFATPLWRKVVVHVDAALNSEREARQAGDLNIQKLEGEVCDLRKVIDSQNAYLTELRGAGLHSMLTRHMVDEIAEPGTVLSAVGDVLSGMEPAIASSIHSVSAAEIIAWARVLTDKIEQSKSIAPQNLEFSAATNSAEATQTDIQLLENQLAFNHKMFVDREKSAVLEIGRLENELKLNNSSLTLDRAAPGK